MVGTTCQGHLRSPRIKDGSNLLASQTKIKKKGQDRKTQTRVGLGILLLLFV